MSDGREKTVIEASKTPCRLCMGRFNRNVYEYNDGVGLDVVGRVLLIKSSFET